MNIKEQKFSVETLAILREKLRGVAILPDEPLYDESRTVWNAMIDRRPALIVRPRGAADVMLAVGFARENTLEIAIKSGGHNVAGNAVCEGGLMIDFADMTSVQVDTQKHIVRVEPGALLNDLDRETQAHGLATPVGFISSTGIAGLTLGGGFGYLSRKHGLTVDNLRAVDLVSVKGEFVQANANHNSELFWGIRGGGGNFGIITAFEFELHAVGPQVLSGPVIHDFKDAPTVLHAVAKAMHDASDEVSCLVVMRHAPPAPFIPEAFHGKMILLLALIHMGDPSESEAALAPLRQIGEPIVDAVGMKPYAAFQSAFDATGNAGARNYWKAHYLPELSDDSIDVLCKQATTMTSKESVIGMLSLGGAVARQSADSTPYPHRDANWVLNIQSRWREAEEDEHHISWTREAFDAVTSFSTGGVYVNFLSGDEGVDRVRAAYGDSTFERLTALKNEWDPDNVLHMNQNIKPS
ncbi:FAD-binding oxidoreductase [Psychrobacter sp. ASPA161_9]|uniref:FAD-binding oxidoreductase n=1 Tax=Psychrobacter sp. ASPA161_9 TaxID=3160961 RepID=UPI003F818C8A